MLGCLGSSFRQRSLHPPGNQGNTPRSNALTSPNVNPSLEFSKSVHTSSFNEVWNKISVVGDWENVDVNEFLTDILQPNQEHVQNILNQASSSNPFTHHLSTYFSHTNQICHLLFILNRGIRDTRSLYIPIEKLIHILPTDPNSISQAQCNWAYGIFLKFENVENPIPCPGSHDLNDIHRCFSNLKEKVDGCLHHKLQSKTRSSVCFIGTAFRFAITMASVSAHALAALVTGSGFPPDPKLTKKDLAHIALLDAAAKSAYALHNDLQTIDRLACLLQTDVEGDRFFIRVGIARDRESYAISEVVKRLAKSYPKIRMLLADLEVHICLCFTAINRARSYLLEEIRQVHQTL